MRPSSEEVKLYLHLFTDIPGDNGTPSGSGGGGGGGAGGGPSGADDLCLAVGSHRRGPRGTAHSLPRFLGLEDSGVPLLFHVGES